MPLALARQRLLTATFPYYELAVAGRQWSETGNRQPATDNNPAHGFVYRRRQNAKGEEVGSIVRHVTLKSIANNERAFFSVAQAFFPRTAAWDDLKRELRGVYADSVWEHLAGTVSEPFAAGEHRQIAVKVIDDRGNELMVVKKLSEAEKERA